MRNKKVFLIAVVLLLVVFGLLPTKGQTQVAGIGLPPIGSVSIASVFGGTADKLGAGDRINIYIKDEQGNPYPSVVNGEDENGLLVASEIVFEVELAKGDGAVVKSDSQNFPFVALMGLNPFEIDIPVEVIRADPSCSFYAPASACQDENKKKNPALNNPLTPGRVFLKSIYAKSNVHRLPSGESVGEIRSATFSPNFELFTVGSPPRIAADKSSVKFSETVTLTGANFDETNVRADRGHMSIRFDYAPANTAGGYTESRGINSVFVDDEDLIHYCDQSRIKFEVPEAIPIPPSPIPGGSLVTTFRPMPLGRHTITFFNEYGLSNTINLDLAGGKGVPDDDPACANPSGTITSIEPTSGPVNTTLTINGSGFGVGSRYGGVILSWNHVYINGHNQFDAQEAPVFDFAFQEYIGDDGFKKVNVNQLKVKVPDRATTGPVRVVPGSGYTITGPVFTVTPGRATDEGGGGNGTGEDGGGGEEIVGPGVLSVNSVIPQVLYVDSSNTVILEGEGFSTSVLFGSDNPALSFSEAEVSSDGKVLRVEVDVGSVDPAEQGLGAQIILSTPEGDVASISVGLAPKDPEAPEISSVTVVPAEAEDQVTLIVNGRNFTPDSEVSLHGLPTAILSGFEIDSLMQITAQVTVLDFNPNEVFGFIKRARAAQTRLESPGGVSVANPKGQSNVEAMNGNQLQNPSSPRVYNSTLPKVEKTGFEEICSKGIPLAKCIQQIYLLSLGLGSIIALLMIILAGYRYMTAQGNAQQVEKAKEAFAAAFIGLIIIFVAFILLYVINPDLVQFRSIGFGR